MEAMRLRRALLRSRKFNGMLSLGLRLMGRLGSRRGSGVDSLLRTRLRESGILMLGENFIYGLPCLSLDFECNWFAWLYYSRFFFSWEEGGGGERTPVPGMLSGMRSCWTDAGKACAGGCPGSEVQGVRIEWRGGSSV